MLKKDLFLVVMALGLLLLLLGWGLKQISENPPPPCTPQKSSTLLPPGR